MRPRPLLAVLPALVLAACGGDAAAPADDGGAPDPPAEVVVEGFRFDPSTFEVTVGTSVTWRNTDSIDHTATSGSPGQPDGAFRIDLPEPGTSGEHTFGRTGTYAYHCEVHPSMTGAVVVSG